MRIRSALGLTDLTVIYERIYVISYLKRTDVDHKKVHYFFQQKQITLIDNNK